MSNFIDQNFGMVAACYLLAGFIIGWIGIRNGDCESPAETWLFMTFAGPIFVVGLAAILLPIFPFYLLVSLLGIETSESDSHGV